MRLQECIHLREHHLHRACWQCLSDKSWLTSCIYIYSWWELTGLETIVVTKEWCATATIWTRGNFSTTMSTKWRLGSQSCGCRRRFACQWCLFVYLDQGNMTCLFAWMPPKDTSNRLRFTHSLREDGQQQVRRSQHNPTNVIGRTNC